MQDLTYFYHEVEYQDKVQEAEYDELGDLKAPAVYQSRIETKLKPRPECKPRSALDRVIALGKPQAVALKFAEMVVHQEQWEWFDRFKEYEEAKAKWEEDKESFIPEALEESEELTVFDIPEPSEPWRPLELTAEQVLLPYYSTRRAAEYPELSEFADAYVKSQAGDYSQMDVYIKDCLAVKAKYPKS